MIMRLHNNSAYGVVMLRSAASAAEVFHLPRKTATTLHNSAKMWRTLSYQEVVCSGKDSAAPPYIYKVSIWAFSGLLDPDQS
jgi:hypothetical protein